MIIVLKDKDSVYIASSIECSYSDVHMDDIINEENLKMWRPEGKDGCIMAFPTSSAPCIDTLRYEDIEALNKPLTSSVIIREINPYLKELFDKQHMLDGEDMWTDIVIAKDDKAYYITSTFTVCDIEDFDSVGSRSSEDIAYGFLAMNRELDPIDRIAGAFRAIEAGDASKHFPVVVMNTKTGGRIVIEK